MAQVTGERFVFSLVHGRLKIEDASKRPLREFDARLPTCAFLLSRAELDGFATRANIHGQSRGRRRTPRMRVSVLRRAPLAEGGKIHNHAAAMLRRTGLIFTAATRGGNS